MIFASGAGAMQDAARAMRKLHNKATRSRQQAKSRRGGGGAPESGYEPVSVGYACAELCGTCGYFLDLEADESEHTDPQCPSCGSTAWVNLEIEPVASAVREMEAEERNRVPLWVKAALVGTTFALTAAVAGLLHSAWFGYFWIWFVGISIPVVPGAYFLLRRPIAVLLLKGRERLPDRWHVPLPLPEEDRDPTRKWNGVAVQPGDETIEAPISGRECIAYQICVLFDTGGDARPPEWALEEQRAVPALVPGAGGEGGVEIASDELYLETPVEFVHATGESTLPVPEDRVPADVDVEYDEVKRFLRERGLFITEGDYHFYEAVLASGDAVDIRDYTGDTYIVEHTDKPGAGEVDALPESLEQ